MDPANPGLCVNVFCRPFSVQRYGALFTRKRYGVMGALKKALWRFEGHPAKILAAFDIKIWSISVNEI